ncbi:MAG: hypothetical protein LUD47_07915 [Clostridia bacterium]|nr:hypothetical protein [Clostridia bacterium]
MSRYVEIETEVLEKPMTAHKVIMVNLDLVEAAESGNENFTTLKMASGAEYSTNIPYETVKEMLSGRKIPPENFRTDGEE